MVGGCLLYLALTTLGRQGTHRVIASVEKLLGLKGLTNLQALWWGWYTIRTRYGRTRSRPHLWRAIAQRIGRRLFLRKRPLSGCRQQLRQPVGSRRIRRGPQHGRQMRIVVVLDRRLLPNHPVRFKPGRRDVLPFGRIPDRGDCLTDRSSGGRSGLSSARLDSFLYPGVASEADGMVPRGFHATMQRPATFAAADGPSDSA